MKIIKPYTEIYNARGEAYTREDGESALRLIELAGRVCYKSESRIGDGTAESFVANIIRRGHESVLEHAGLAVRFVCGRAIAQQITRHRIPSYSMESQRYCNYAEEKFGDQITVIEPLFFDPHERAAYDSAMTRYAPKYEIWHDAIESCEYAYKNLLERGATPQEARAVLPNCTKTELIMTVNFRGWRQFLKTRTASGVDPELRYLTIPLLKRLKDLIPVVFDDVGSMDHA